MTACESELCGICFTSELGEEPCVRLNCGHVFHANCVLMMLTHRWTTTRITFGYLDCPSCKQEIMLDYRVPILTNKLLEQMRLKAKILTLIVQAAIAEGYDKAGRVVTEGDIYYGKLFEFAVHQTTFYECFKCQQPYFGGMEDCAQAMQSENAALRKENLLCKNCVIKEMGYGQATCEKHGDQYIDYKCMYCCSMAMHVCCGGTQYFCDPCHSR